MRGAAPPHLRDPIDVVKAALDGTPRRRSSHRRRLRRGAHRAAADHRVEGRHPRRSPASATRSTGSWSRRVLYAAVAVLVVLPIVTFAMAYLIVDVPKPGDIRTNQVSTILASDGSELAKIVPPEGNRVDVNIDQIPRARAQRGDGRRGPRLLLQPGLLVHRLRPRLQEQHLRRRPAGRLDDHPAVRQERVGRRRAFRASVVWSARPRNW